MSTHPTSARPVVAQALRARATAIAKLVEMHKEDFADIHGDEREKVGLPRKVGTNHAAAYMRVAELEALLRRHGIEVDE